MLKLRKRVIILQSVPIVENLLLKNWEYLLKKVNSNSQLGLSFYRLLNLPVKQ
jgi:hypothetical protein